MKKSFFKINIYEIFCFLLTFFVIVLSKSVYFGIVNRSFNQYILYALSAISFVLVIFNRKNNKSLKPAFILFVIMETLFLMNLIFHYDIMSSSQINSVIGNMLIFCCLAIIVNVISVKNFSKWYIKILYIICLISIPCFIIASINPKLALSLCQEGYNWKVAYGYSPFYTWGINGIINHRNSGIFWEPGAFQGFLILAILIILFDTHKNNVKNPFKKLLVFIVTLLTTQSTTGYVLLLLLFLSYRKSIESRFFVNEFKKIGKLLTVLSMFMAVFIILSTGVIENKIVHDNTGSTEIRTKDIYGGAKLVLRGGLFGLGETNDKTKLKIEYGVDMNDSVGLFSMAYTFGLIFLIIYIFSLYKGIINFFNLETHKDKIIIFSIFIILNLTEGIWFLPVYLYILFSKKDNKQLLNNT